LRVIIFALTSFEQGGMKMELTLSQEPTVLPAPVAEMLDRCHQDGTPPEACARCAAGCCSRGGFAILENVMRIYERYRAGQLQRADYQFAGGLNFREFVEQYFDIQVWTPESPEDGKGVVIFHMKNLGPGGSLVSIPQVGEYWDVRNELFDRNPWLNRGCIFLSEGLPDGGADDGRTGRHCILHEAQSGNCVTAKPIDCVFFTCTEPGVPRSVDEATEEQWLATLAACFPGSIERFKRL
jgi:hypothetical protein